MDWIKKFDLFLFDFDGLLVNTEELHYNAYKLMMSRRNVEFTWDFERYCKAAHYEAFALRDQFKDEFPQLLSQAPEWPVFYKEKQNCLLELIEAGKAHLMPGVENLLNRLVEANIPRAVVTHSPSTLIELVRRQNPILNTIPVWITREQYTHPKPDPECYQKAIAMLSKPGYNIIGFEDTPRGINALSKTEALPVIICKIDYPELPLFIQNGVKHFTSFENVVF